MNAAASNLVISLLAMQVARRIDFTEPQTLTMVRVAYVSVQALILSIYYYTSFKIKQKNDLTVLKYVEPANPMAGNEPNLVTTTVKDYDLADISKAMRSVYMGAAMMAFMHGYMNYTQPLFVQALMGLKALYDAKEVRIHILGQPAEGDLKRPFKVGGFMGAAADPQTDKAAISEAEKKVAKKDE